ncbi:Hypothetical protein, putative [Bodo saltans]|uniref:Fibronectin type-III domain-containing protein n=1 Tax=Bodo saltans TaxID=75058 RepID=A0A0S4JDY0_BODSA|nr:Hypothetical protein, putative [Bodo saltans]|eukprot:CUG89777.1 Hypothetical protein, putative [Bodo saltans]
MSSNTEATNSNDNTMIEGAVVRIPTDPTFDLAAAQAALECQALLWRTDEMFAEFGFHLSHPSTQIQIGKWHLRVQTEGKANDVAYDDELSTTKTTKMVKLKPSTAYLFKTRVFSDTHQSWGPWSTEARLMTLATVVTSIKEIGEDYVRLMWDRPLRQDKNIAEEINPEATRAIADIQDFKLLVVRESDKVQEFFDVFAAGVRTYTLHELRPATAYIVFAEYMTLSGSAKQSYEVCRFYTQASHESKLKRRGEDTFTVEWARAPLPDHTVGYLLPDSTIHRFEVTVEGDGADEQPVELAASTKHFTASSLCPGATYAFRVRCLTKEGRWGARAKPLMIRLADRPTVRPVAIGETFLSVGWTRPHHEVDETKVEFEISHPLTGYRRSHVLEIASDEKDRVVHIDALQSGTVYDVTLRTFLVNEWGLWCEPRRIRTSPKTSVVFKERGEDFLTVDWSNNLFGIAEEEKRVMSQEGRYLFKVSRVDSDGDRQPILEEEIQRKTHGDGLRIGSLVPDTQYEVKCAAWQRNPITKSEGWGEFSAPLLTQTLQSVALQVLDVGEDFAQLSWRRSLRTDAGKSIVSPSAGGNSQHVWMDLKYEIVVGCLDTGNDCLVHKEVLDTTYTITNLLPNTNYVISVRACDEKEQWGLWCRLLLRTLPAIETSIHEVGEDFLRLMWQRNSDRESETPLVAEEQAAVIGGPAAGGEITARHTTPRSVEQYVAQYAVFVFSDDVQEVHVPHKEAQYYRGGNSESAVLEHVASHHSSCRIGGLLPDRDYVMVVRALTSSGKWGLWSAARRFRTVSQFRIPVNFLSIGENYVHIVWNRDEHPAVDADVVLGDFTVVAQQLRIVGVDTQYSKDHALEADLRELKLYGLSPTTAYYIQLRACSKTGEWGLWSTPVHILTRATITTRPVEVAEDYLVLSWERKRAPNPKNYPTGKGLVTSYHLRVSNAAEGVCMETFLGDGDCPYRIAGLKPDTYYCVELKANYNDEEWGLWSTPLWCLTMRHLDVKTQLISEEFCTVKVIRPSQNKRLPEDDGNRVTEDRVIAFGQVRSHCMLCVTTPPAAQAPHHAAASGARSSRPSVSAALPADCLGHRLVYQVELICEHEELIHTIPNLKANTMYHASVRSKLDASEWGMWSSPSLRFASVPTISVGFAAIGENYITAEWRRGAQNIPPALLSKVQCGLGIISKSRLKLRDMSGGSATRIFDIDSSANQLYIDDLAPASTYAISVQTFNDNFAWGMWSEDAKVRTVPSMDIVVEHITEDAVWVSWNRRPDLSQPIAHDTVLNVDSNVKNYEVKIVGDGHFCFARELESNKLFFRGLQPDTIYELKVRALNKNDGHWGLWSSQYFRTQPMMRITFGNIGEHFAVVEWRRHLPQSAHWDPTATSLVEAEDVVQEFRLKVEKVGEEPVIHELSPNVSSFRFTNLMPSAEYRVWMCAKGHEGVWGLWNEEARVRTLPQLDLNVKDIGEDYVSVSWTRLKWDGDRAPDAPGVKVWEIDGAVSGYHVKVLDAEGNVFAQQHLSYTTTSCTLSHLNLKSIYSVQVCAKDTYNEWGLWSETRRFVTLQPVKMSLLRIGEDHVDIEWGRRGQIRRRFITEVVSDAEIEDGEDDDDDGTNIPIPTSAGSDNAAASGSEGDMLDPLDHPAEDVFEDSFGSVAELEEDIIRGDEVVKQWHVRVYGRRIFGGQPGSEDYVEFFVDTAVTNYHIASLLPKATYSLTVRAQNMHGEWGHWCHQETVVTMPLLTLDLDYIGETFLLASWARPKHDHSHLVCFPAPMGNHNYQVQIRPMATEDPFNAQEEPLVDGARVYETTQPSLQLSNLKPGCRYRVTVREEMINPLEPDVRPLVPNFGVFCEASIVETIEPTFIDPNEIGEDYCAVNWGRRGRNRASAHSEENEVVVASLIKSKAKVTGYEIQAVRLDDNADQVYKGPLALELMKSFQGGTQEFKLVHLAPNAIYAITARSQTEGGYWGLWSTPSKFVTQKRLTLHVELINEDSCVVSWAREMPDWAANEVLRLHSATPDVDATSSIAGDDEDFPEDVESNTNTPPPPINPLLESVIIGDYTVNLFEVVVEGVNHTFEQKLVLPNAKMSARISGLASNLIYTVSIRSMSERENWSLFSPKVSVCTLRGMELTISHYSENLGSVSWHRQSQSIVEHTKYLNKLRDNMTREAEHHERKERFEMEQERLSQEAIGDEDAPAPNATPSAAAGGLVLSFQERQRQLEHYMANVAEMTHCLIPDNVHLGKAEVSGYQLQLHGSGGTPFIAGTNHLMATTKKRGSSRKKGGATPSSRGGNNQAASSINSASSGVAANPLRTAVSGDRRSVPRSGRQSSMSTGGGAAQEEESIAVDAADDNVLLDSKINSKTSNVCILGLQEGTTYELSVRARNLHQEWGPWSDRTQLVTLKLIQLSHTRFGEHYINLFWHRIPQSELQQEQEHKATLAKFEEEFKDITPKELEVKKQSLEPGVYQALVARIREWKTLQRAVTAHAANICDGLGTVEAAPNTPVRGYHLRVVHENGSIRDSYFEDAGVNKGHQFTVTGLQPNTMYVAMMCADYGLGEWGAWSEPIRFMTQNLIQLQLSYVGESFIDIEWRRAPNKKLARIDDGLVLVNPTTQGRGHQYEVCIRALNPDTAEETEERRAMNDCSKFRIEHLQTDTKYTLTVREWDAKGEWGLWSGARICCTLAGMDASVHEIGENWVQLSWSRRPRRKLPGEGTDNNPHANITQLPVEAVSYYLRVEELVDNGYDQDVRDLEDSTGSPSAEPHDSPQDEGHEEDIASLLDHHHNSSHAEDDVELDNQGPLPLPPPAECDPEENEDIYSTPGGAHHRRRRYVNVKKFHYDTNEMKIDNLRPDTFYNVQVLCETTGGQLGTWSCDRFILSLAKIRLRTDLIDEQNVRLSWSRDQPRHHPRLNAPVVTGAFHTNTFDLEAYGHEKKTASYQLAQQFPSSTQEYKLCDLMLNSAYRVRIRGTDDQGRLSLWSDDLHFATLKPLRVLTGKILEHHAAIEWGRDPQSATDYPPTSTPMLFGVERANQYHLRVYTPHERTVPMADKQFAGTVTRYNLVNLAPNACYIVQARSCNVIGEWGLWSEERVIYTMKLVELDITAVGEDYIKVSWRREEPDELQEMVQVEKAALDDVDDEALVDEAALKALMMRKRYPLLDKPTDRNAAHQAVYASARTAIFTYTLSITKRGETEDIVMEVPASSGGARNTSSWTVSHLRPDTQYSIAIRAYYGDEDWGLWSERVVSGTMNLLAADVKYVGEDYLSASWQRMPTSYPTNGDARVGKTEETLCYEFKLFDFSDVPIGEEAAADLDALQVREVLVAKLKVATIKALRSNRRYRMCVRRWYHPIEEAGALVPVMEESEKPLSEEQRLRVLMERNHGTPGAWSDAVFAITLKDMVVLVDEIAEDSLNIHWDRDPNAAVLPTRQCLKVPTVVLSYHVRIDAMTNDGSIVDNAANTLHLDHVFGPEETSYVVPDLRPDAVYKVDVRCCTDKVWGQWSRTVYVVTLPKLSITLQSIGEDYVSLQWTRNIRSLTLPDGTAAVVGNSNNVEKYHMDMTGVDHHFRLEKKFKASRTSYRVKHLEAQTVYHIAVRSCDVHGTWSLWSEAVVFATLKPLRLHLGKAGEQFVHVSWDRPEQTVEEYQHVDPNIQLGNTNVLSYHLCAFAMDQAPSTAVVDKQFHGDVSKYRITTLTPNTSYIIIVRACNDESQWGLWSEERIIRTQRVLTLQIGGIGENYVKVRWEREESDGGAQSAGGADAPASDATLGLPSSFHLAITSEVETVDRHFTLEECNTSNELRLPEYLTNNLTPDTKYLIALQPCYGNDEWGLWTKPLTFVTLNRISIMTTSVSESKVELAWGRAQQSVELAADPNIVTWRGTIVKYQLLMRKVEEMNAAARRERERSLHPTVVAESDMDPAVEGSGAAQPRAETSDALVVTGSNTSGAVDGNAVALVSDDVNASSTKRRQSLVQEPDELRIERDIDVKQVKYVQTSCTIDSLMLNTDYHVQVRALDDANEWGCWTELLFDTPPPPPTNVMVRKSGAQFCLVTWDAPDVTNRYQHIVEQAVMKETTTKRGRVDMSEWKVVDTVEEPQSRIRAFGPMNKIRFRVKSCKLDRPTHIMSQYSDVVGMSTSNPPEPVGSLAVATLARNSATIEWSKPAPAPGEAPPSAGADRGQAQPAPTIAYRVLLSIKEQPPVLLTTTKNLTYTLNDLEPNTAYKVQVQVEADSGISQRNVVLRFTTKAESDRTVSRAQAGQPPLGMIISRPGTQEGANSGQEAVRLPAIAVASTQGPKRGTSPLGKGGRTRSTSGGKAKTLSPKPPLEGGTAARRAPRSSPKRAAGGVVSPKRGGSPPNRGAGAAGGSPNVAPTRPPVPRPKDQSLPPVRSRQGAPPQSKGPVEQFDFVEFQPSDDEEK